MSASYYLTVMVDNCVPRRQLGSCSVTRPFLSLRRVWLVRLARRKESVVKFSSGFVVQSVFKRAIVYVLMLLILACLAQEDDENLVGLSSPPCQESEPWCHKVKKIAGWHSNTLLPHSHRSSCLQFCPDFCGNTAHSCQLFSQRRGRQSGETRRN